MAFVDMRLSQGFALELEGNAVVASCPEELTEMGGSEDFSERDFM